MGKTSRDVVEVAGEHNLTEHWHFCFQNKVNAAVRIQFNPMVYVLHNNN